jgi:beta-glucosidase
MRLRNLGLRAGSTVLQVYLAPPGRLLTRPLKTLCAFRKLTVSEGGEVEVAFRLPLALLACFDPQQDAFVVEPGRHGLLAGFSVADLRLATEVDL